jgi:hypothetical protein
MSLIAALATGCTTSSSAGVAPPSTFGADSPWLGAFSPVALPAPVNSLTGLDCVSVSRCWAIGSTVGAAGAPNGAALIATTSGGAKWDTQVIPPTVGYLSGISCSDKLDCTAVGQAVQTSTGQAVIIATDDGGVTWTQEPAPPGILDLTAVTCQADGRCIAVGTSAGGAVTLVSTAAGSAWAQLGALPASMSGPTAISCADDQSCWVTGHAAVDIDHVAGNVAFTTDGGSSWTAVTTPTGIGYLNGISCLNGSTTGNGALPTTPVVTTSTAPASAATAAPAVTTTTAPAVTTTTAPAVTTTTVPAVGLAGVRCTVVGTTANTLNGARTGHGLVLTTDNGGSTWSNQSVTANSASLMDVSCTAIGSCVIVGSTVATSPQAGVVILTGSPGNPWKRPATVSSPQSLTAVSCTSSSSCVVVGESISEHLVGG